MIYRSRLTDRHPAPTPEDVALLLDATSSSAPPSAVTALASLLGRIRTLPTATDARLLLVTTPRQLHQLADLTIAFAHIVDDILHAHARAHPDDPIPYLQPRVDHVGPPGWRHQDRWLVYPQASASHPPARTWSPSSNRIVLAASIDDLPAFRVQAFDIAVDAPHGIPTPRWLADLLASSGDPARDTLPRWWPTRRPRDEHARYILS